MAGPRIRHLIVLAVLLFCGCGNDDGRARLLIYSSHGRDILAEFEASFEKTHPEVDVETAYMGSTEILNRVRAEAKNPQATIWWGGPVTDLEVAASEGLLAPYKPTYGDVLPVHSQTWAWTSCFELPIVLGYNPKLIRADELPKTFAALGDRRFKGRLCLRKPEEAGTLRTFVAAMVMRRLGSEGGEDAAFDELLGIHQNVGIYLGSPELMFERLESGPECLTIWNLTDLVFQHERKGYSFVPAPLEEPVPVIVDGIALVRGAESNTWAQKFYETVNSMDSMKRMAEAHGRIPARSDFPREALGAGIRAVPYAPMSLDRVLQAKKTPEWMKRFEQLRSMSKPK